MTTPPITPQDAKNLLALLERVTLKATEVNVFVELRTKLELIHACPQDLPQPPE